MSDSKPWQTPQDRWQEKSGYKTKGFKLKVDLTNKFVEACKKEGEYPATVISRMMEEYIKNMNETK